MSYLRVATLLCLSLLITSSLAVPSHSRHASASLQRKQQLFHSPLDHKAALHVFNQAEKIRTSRSGLNVESLPSFLNRLFEKRTPSTPNGLESALAKVSDRQGLIGGLCSSDSQCQDPRQCVTIQQAAVVPCTPDSLICACFSPLLCSSGDDCDSGELCLSVANITGTVCVSEDVITSTNFTVAVSEGGSGTVSIEIPDSPQTQGLNGDLCSSQGDCTESRRCFTLMGANFISCSGQENCRCVARDPSCSSISDCSSGEVCQFLDADGSVGFCISALLVPGNPAAQTNETAIEEEQHDLTDEMDMPIETHEFGVSCTTDDDCDIDESCTALGPTGRCTPDGNPSFGAGGEFPSASVGPIAVDADVESPTDEPGSEFIGVTPTGDDSDLSESEEPSGTFEDECQTNDDCEDGETCTASDGLSVCEAVLNGEEDVSVCISTHHLSHMKQEELLYLTHRVARVLCDNSNSCATPGHMIKYKGAAMMMSTYCDAVGCISKLKTVNSPRYSPGKVVKSNSDGLEFTAHAARYNTRMEEKMLSLAVRIGL
ncbi:unnamed protein product [Agarophyton chilense]|eukprot:gb/GEZJ01000071.1/.p1 GENE.gb/GEZJ01000071.1/~~gb/GEZJ01000071.1/.p1  ORF type:complete len:544 (-),score=74.32 gb/GEZJ01000071.1/:166-1797(-)